MKLGVAIYIKNHSFKWGYEYSDTLSADASSGSTSITVSNSSGLLKALKAGDRILIGPNSNYMQETKVIASIDTSTSTIYFYSGLENDYESGDYIRGVGSALAGAWTPNANATPQTISPSSRGYDDGYAQVISLGNDTYPGNLRQYLDDDEIPPSSTLRLGFYYKLLGGNIWARVYDGSSSIISIDVSPQSDWTSISSTGSSGTGPSGSYVEFAHHSGTPVLTLDCVWLCHAVGTDGENQGYWEFTEYPDLGSVQWKTRSYFATQVLFDGTMRRYSKTGTGDKVRKYVFECAFSNVSSSFWDNLVKFQEWCDKGRYLVFFPEIADLPPVLVGVMNILESDYKSHRMWDTNRKTFRFTFEEV